MNHPLPLVTRPWWLRRPVVAAVGAVLLMVALSAAAAAIASVVGVDRDTVLTGVRFAAAGLFAFLLLRAFPSERDLLLLPREKKSWLWVAGALAVVGLTTVLGVTPSALPAAPTPGDVLTTTVRAGGIGVVEEVLFRGLILALLLAAYAHRAQPVWRAVVVSSVLFATVHLPNVLLGEGLVETLGQVVAGGFLGVFAAGLTLWARSVWPAALAHAAFIVVFDLALTNSTPPLLTAALFVIAYLPLMLAGVWMTRRVVRRGGW
jgi:membrane protease YdiL (CAAX protease family)